MLITKLYFMEHKRKRNRKLCGKALQLLEIVTEGSLLTKKEFSLKLYGDKNHIGSVSSLIRTLQHHGQPVAVVKTDPSSFPPKPGVVKLLTATKEPADARNYVNGDGHKNIVTRVSTLLCIGEELVQAYPAIALEILPKVEEILRVSLNTKHALAGGYEQPKLSSGNDATIKNKTGPKSTA